MMADIDADKRDKRSKTGLGFLFSWMLANGLGAIIGVAVFFSIAVSAGLFGSSLPPETERSTAEALLQMMVIAGLFAVPLGGIIGVAQWLVLRRVIKRAGLWILASVIGMFVGMLIFDILPLSVRLSLPGLFLFWSLFGGVAGVLQWLVLWRQVRYSGLWIVASAVAGCIAGIFWPDMGIIGGGMGWAMGGVITGMTLLWLFRGGSGKNEEHKHNESERLIT